MFNTITHGPIVSLHWYWVCFGAQTSWRSKGGAQTSWFPERRQRSVDVKAILHAMSSRLRSTGNQFQRSLDAVLWKFRLPKYERNWHTQLPKMKACKKLLISIKLLSTKAFSHRSLVKFPPHETGWKSRGLMRTGLRDHTLYSWLHCPLVNRELLSLAVASPMGKIESTQMKG